MTGICTADGCVRAVKAKGKCKKHYMQDYYAGGAPGQGWCAISGCKRRVHAKRLCNKHYQRNSKYGDPNYLKGAPPAMGGCHWLDGSMEPCGKPVGGPSGWCRDHSRAVFG